MCDGMKTEKAEFVKALDNFINARIHEGIHNYHYKKGRYEWLEAAKPSYAPDPVLIINEDCQLYCPKCGTKKKAR